MTTPESRQSPIELCARTVEALRVNGGNEWGEACHSSPPEPMVSITLEDAKAIDYVRAGYPYSTATWAALDRLADAVRASTKSPETK